jgi:hypothetical protein
MRISLSGIHPKYSRHTCGQADKGNTKKRYEEKREQRKRE